MDRRTAITLIGATSALGMGTALAKAQHSADPLQSTGDGGRRQTGRVDLIISGTRNKSLKDARAIVETAKATRFFESGRFAPQLPNGSVEYVPAIFPANAISMALIEGLLVHRFTISGAPPAPWSVLGSGTYYTFIDFVEGPDFDTGRWVSRVVDDSGKTRRVNFGVEVRQLIDFNVDEKMRQEHSRPSVHLHGFVAGEADRPLELLEAVQSWSVTNGDWVAAGNGCARVQTCTPLQ